MESLRGNQMAVPRISQLREKAGITQLELSQLVGVTETSIQNWERGRAGIDQIERVIKLCEVLNCEPKELIEYVEISEVANIPARLKGRDKLQRMRQLLGTDKEPISYDENNTNIQVEIN